MSSPDFRSREYGPRRVYPLMVTDSREAETMQTTPEQQNVITDTTATPCFRCGVPMLKKDIYGMFDNNPVCQQCYMDLERAENAGTLDQDYVNAPSVDEEKTVKRRAQKKESKDEDDKPLFSGDEDGKGLFDF